MKYADRNARFFVTSFLMLSIGLGFAGAAAAETRGIELGVEGANTAMQGTPLRWFFTLYEIVGNDQLRPAETGRLSITTSIHPDAPAVLLSTDIHGRAAVEIPVPEDAWDFEVAVEAHAGPFRRTFTMSVAVSVPNRIAIVADREAIQPGESVTFVGRTTHIISGRPIPKQMAVISITDQDGRSIGAERRVETNAVGIFRLTVTPPPSAELIRCTAHIDGLEDVSTEVTVRSIAAPRMVITAVPAQRIVRPGARVSVDIAVHRSDGRPVRGADIRMTNEETPPDAPPVTTDDAGRARITWIASRSNGNNIEDRTVGVSATRAGLGRVGTEFTVRTARTPYQTDITVEGGSLMPGLPARLYVKVIRADGTPARSTRVGIENLLLGTLAGETDADGIAVFDGRPVLKPGIEGQDRCGGITASAVTATVYGAGKTAPDAEPAFTTFMHCVPVDPDGTVRVRPSKSAWTPGEAVSVQLTATPNAANAPIEVALLRLDESSDNTDSPAVLVPVSRQILKTTGQSRRVSIPLPQDSTGIFMVRARPLVGRALEPARGGTALIYAAHGAPIRSFVETETDTTARLSIKGAENNIHSLLLAVPADEADALQTRLEQHLLSPLERRFEQRSDSGETLLESLLADRTLRDDAVPTVLRRNKTVIMPACEQPASAGLLRDPIRARARFVRGRLALSIKTLEARLEKAHPDHIRDVGIRRFNREAFNAVKGSDLIEGREPMTLGGEPLTLEDLEQMDSSFTFDNMARRITRKRLLSLLIHLRTFVSERELDLRLDEQNPSRWLDVLVETAEEPDDNDHFDNLELDTRMLYDGWGRKMAVLKVAKGRTPQFQFFSPLPFGFALISAGPDGRFHTGDDLIDPFARVLPSGSVYAEAVGEDALIARLNRIEVSRATVEAVAALFDELYGETREDESLPEPGPMEHQTKLPRLKDGPGPNAQFERTWRPVERSAMPPGTSASEARIPFSVDDEPRRWSLVAVTSSAEGRTTFSRKDFSSGFPVVLDVEPLRRLAPHEPLLVPVTGALLPGGPKDLIISVKGSGSVRAELEGGGTAGPLVVGPGGGFETRIRLRAEGEGNGEVRIAVSKREGQEERVVTLPIEASHSGLLRKLYASSAVSQTTTLRLDVPADATVQKGTLVLVGPDTVQDDPNLTRWIARDPALIAWTLSVMGRPLTGDVVRHLETATRQNGAAIGIVPSLSTACAAAAWAAVDATDTRFDLSATRNAVVRQSGGDPRENLAMDAAVLAALSLAVGPDDHTTISSTIESIRKDLRDSIRKYRKDPAFLARGAAALLLADREDIRGKTMLALAKTHLCEGYRGGLAMDLSPSNKGGLAEDLSTENDDNTVAAANRSGAEQLTATAALAVAAHQVGDEALARKLAMGLASGAAQATTLGGEPLFWFLAARAFGVFGMTNDHAPSSIRLSLGKAAPRNLSLGESPVVIPLDTLTPGDSVKIHLENQGAKTPIPLVYASARYVRPARLSTNGPLTAGLSGDMGFAGERAALVATVSNTGPAVVNRPVLFVALPAGAELDGAAKEAIRRNDAVIDVDDPDTRGIVRVRLKPMLPDGSIELPFPLHWSAAGRRVGLALAVFPEDKDWELSVFPPGEIDIPFRPDDSKP